MIDARGIELQGGEEVMYSDPGCKSMQLGTVMYVTPKGARIMPCEHDWEINRNSAYIVKIESEGEA